MLENPLTKDKGLTKLKSNAKTYKTYSTTHKSQCNLQILHKKKSKFYWSLCHEQTANELKTNTVWTVAQLDNWNK